ncbi:T9SS type B sorting domain-containing protein, partial [Oceanihabitans sp. 1_MG-2023]|uniref:T9SS type B sorting domain-containing protein n=1 Tax=Flavobacteriaceae TaxID=49546 RepID=UPI002091435E
PVTLDASGMATITVAGVTTDQTINLTNVTNPTTSCSGTLTNTETVVVLVNPSITSLSSNLEVCEGDTAIFTVMGGAGNEILYTINGVTQQQVVISNSGEIDIYVNGVVGNQTIVLEQVLDSTTGCSTLLGDTQTVNVIPLVNSTFVMNPNCNGATAVVLGTPGGVFSFNPLPIDGATINSTTGEVVNGVPNSSYFIEYSVSGICNTASQIESFTVYPSPNIYLEDEFVLCLDSEGNIINQPRIETGLSQIDYSFQWIEVNNPLDVLGGGSYYEPMQAGVYSVLVTNNSTGCSTVLEDINTQAIVINSTAPEGLNAIVTSETFADENTVEVSVNEVLGVVYEFSLDGNLFESNNTNSYIYNNVSAGEHLVIVRDKDGCGEASIPIYIIDYPLFFTPNNDGYNDTWQILGLNNQLEAKIYIFDRYGKLLKQISPNGLGWDGTLNGKALPSSDYWFQLEYKDPNSEADIKKKFKAHFTLKR